MSGTFFRTGLTAGGGRRARPSGQGNSLSRVEPLLPLRFRLPFRPIGLTVGAQIAGGRYLIVFFIDKKRGVALPISARDMSPAERKYYATHKQTG